ncbi:MAG TPA: branched-chain amino acid ABC transporter permease [Stellaceae bacterium]|nr:branched-chain amino acid ABC transporter permease [Stellaceae bacterium]
MRYGGFWFGVGAVAVLIAGYVATRHVANDYYFYAAYIVLQYVVLATAWNILGGYAGYVNFGSAGFYAVGAYTAAILYQAEDGVPLPAMILAGGVAAGLIGLIAGYLTLRVKGIYFAIATLALAIVLETIVKNWDYVGGSRGIYVLHPRHADGFANYPRLLFFTMLVLAVGAVVLARLVERSRLGRGLAAIRDDEQAAESAGVPTLRLKLFAATLSGALMGVAGAPFPYYVSHLEPGSAFSLAIAVNAIAMPMIGGATSWVGPVIGAVLLGGAQQIATVTISSILNLLIVGLLLIGFVIFAPEGIVGLLRKLFR